MNLYKVYPPKFKPEHEYFMESGYFYFCYKSVFLVINFFFVVIKVFIRETFSSNYYLALAFPALRLYMPLLIKQNTTLRWTFMFSSTVNEKKKKIAIKCTAGKMQIE